MRCPYCEVEYSVDETCFCQPAATVSAVGEGAPEGLHIAWGDAARTWSEPKPQKSPKGMQA